VKRDSILESTQFKSKVNQSLSKSLQYEFIEPAHWSSWAIFTALNYADIHYTNKALKYSCVYEANPLLPKRPSWDRLVAQKAVRLYPIYSPKFNKYRITDRDLYQASMFMAIVVMHNQHILDKVERNVDICPKIGTI